ncbi:MAG: glycosyltransferase family 4 protein [Alphaproteobacteria bacterium]|nr:glycosyltransferase family 4 protein [Alphaproteobacteria bacterium]
MADSPRIAVLLPVREHYAQSEAGAVSTVVDGFARFSRFRENLRVLGSPVSVPLQGGVFRPVVPAPFWHGSRTRRYLACAVKLLKGQTDLVEIHNRPEFVPYLRRRLPQTALTLHLHNDPRTMRGAQTVAERRKLLRQLNLVVAVSHYIRDCFLDGLDDPASKVVVVHNAVDTVSLIPAPADSRKKELIFVGRTIRDKGLHLLVEAAEKLLPAFPDWKLVVVGGRFFGAGKAEVYENELLHRVVNLGGQGEVTGYVPHAEAVNRLRHAAIAVLPSLWEEPFLLTAIEAAAAGCAVITTRRGGIPEAMGDGALYLPEETSYSLAVLLRSLMENPSLLWDQQKKARDHVVKCRDLRAEALRLDGYRLKV